MSQDENRRIRLVGALAGMGSGKRLSYSLSAVHPTCSFKV